MDSADAPERDGRRQGVLAAVGAGIGLVVGAAKRQVLAVVVLTVVAGACTAAELLAIRRVVALLDERANADAGDLLPWLIVLGLAILVANLATTWVNEIRMLLYALVGRRVTGRVLDVATQAEIDAYETPEFHDHLQRARERADSSAWEVVWGLVSLLSTSVSVVAVAAVLLAVAPVLVLVAIMAFVPLALVGALNARALYRVEYELASVDRDRLYHERLLTGRLEAKEIRAFGLASWLRARHDRLYLTRIEHMRAVVRTRVAWSMLGSLATTAVLVGALGWVAVLVLHDDVTVEAGAVAVLGLQQLSSRLRSVTGSLTSIIEGVAFLRDFERFEAPRTTIAPPSRTPPSSPERVSLHDVSYRYPASELPAVQSVSLELRPGKVLAIVGPNGSGKSTLAKILCGLLRPTAGALFWDDVDVAECDPRDVRALVAPVFQDFARYEHEAGENVMFGDVSRPPDPVRIRLAAKKAGFDDVVSSLPEGYGTRLSTSFANGTELSVGQWQRLAIARAFYRDAPLVVMDEPAASLDPRAENDLVARLHELGHEKMVVYVSHRFATVREADEIVVMLGGAVVERGTHAELMAIRGVYAELYATQAALFA